MRIGIDARLIGQTGVGVYISNLLRELEKIAPKDIEFVLYLNPSVKFQISNLKFQIKQAPYRWHSLSEQIGFLKQINADQLDLMHFTYFSFPIFYTRPFVSTIHDLTPLFFKTGRASTRHHLTYNLKHQAYSLLMKRAVSASKAIITPTTSVKKQIIDHYGNRFESKIAVTYEGVNKDLINAEENKSLAKQFNKPYLLYVGNFYPHKNVERLVDAFSKLETGHELVLVGPDDFFAKRLKKVSNVRMYHNPNLSDFVFFYKNAQALVHPSLSEGFGLPIVEASYFKLPIVASNIDVFDELLGKDRLSFDPESVEQISDALTAYISNPEIYQNQFVSTEKMSSAYSFPKMAKSTLEVYKEVLK